MFSPYQEPIEWIEKFNSNSTLNTISGYAEIFGEVELNRFQKAIRMLEQAHPILRIRIKDNLLSSTSIELNEQMAEVDFFDFSSYSDSYTQALQMVKEKSKKAISLDSPSLFRNVLIKISSHHFIWFLQIHHWIADGWSVALIFQKASSLYTFPSQAVEQFSLNHPFKQYAQSKDYERDKKFWEGTEIAPSFPTQHHAYPSERISFRLSARLVRLLKNFCKTYQITPFHFILSVWAILQYRMADSSQVVLGLPLLNRKNKKDKNSIGLFTNFLPFCLEIEDSANILDVFWKVKETLRSIYKHQSFPLSDLSRLNQEKGISGRFFETLISYEVHPYGNFFATYPAQLHYLPHYQDDNKMTIHWMEYTFQNDIQIAIDYATDYFNLSKIKILLDSWQAIAFDLARNPHQAVHTISTLSKGQRTLWKKTCIGKTEPLICSNLWDSFAQFSQLCPEKTALVFQNQSLTFGALSHQAQCVARHLLQHQLLTDSSSVVALVFERNPMLVVGMLGVMCAGATFLILDSSDAPERTIQLLQQSKCEVILTNLMDLEIPSARIIDWESIHFKEKTAVLQNEKVSSDIAYHIYTSGTSGTPKGIAISKKNLAHMIQSWQKAYHLKDATVLSWANSTFDVFIGDVGRSILLGNTLILTDKDERISPEKIIQLIEKYAVTHLEIVPAFAELLVETIKSQKSSISLQSTRYWIMGSDKFTTQLYRKLQQILPRHTQIINSYGLSECTIDTTFMNCNQVQNIDNDLIPIGFPFENQAIYVLDKCLQPCPAYQLGKLYIGGEGIGRYLDRNLDNKFYTQHPLWGKIFATEDWAFWEKEKGITFWGRKDTQFKINGMRIDLKEIELATTHFSSIKQCVAFLNLRQQLVLAYTAEYQTSNQEIQRYLSQKLPSYMLPTFFWELETFPINANGKIAILELQRNWESTFSYSPSEESPQTNQEKILVAIWEQLFQKPVSRNANFWLLGGNSIQAIRMIGLLRQQKVELTIQQIFKNPILQHLALQIAPLSEKKEKTPTFEINADEMQRVLDVLGKKLK